MELNSFVLKSLEAYYNGERVAAEFSNPNILYSSANNDGNLHHCNVSLCGNFTSDIDIEKAWEIEVLVNGLKAPRCQVKKESRGNYKYHVVDFNDRPSE